MQGLRSLLQACAVGPCACAAGWLDTQPSTSDGPVAVTAVPNRAIKVDAVDRRAVAGARACATSLASPIAKSSAWRRANCRWTCEGRQGPSDLHRTGPPPSARRVDHVY
jgi:hypothetical protein